MGKSQKKRAMRRHNPVRVPDTHLPKGLASATSSSTKTEAIPPIIQKMESPDPAERKWACVAVSNIIHNDPATRRLLQGKNVVGALINRLSDSESDVMLEAAGALRNLCVDGGYDICAEMYNKNILAPLKTFVPKISTTLSQFLESPKTAPENSQKVIYEFADNVITTLWCLSETSNKALNAINEINLVPFLMSFLASREKLPLSTVTAAAQCLYVLTDDNKPITDELRRDAAYISCLLDIIKQDVAPNGKGKDISDERAIMFRVLTCGIIRNISPLPPPAAASFDDVEKELVLPLLQPVISSVSLSEASTSVQTLVAQPDPDSGVETLSKEVPQLDLKSPKELELERIERQLRNVQLSLEILTSVCATLPDPEPFTPGDYVPKPPVEYDDEYDEENLADQAGDYSDDYEEFSDQDVAMDVVPTESTTGQSTVPFLTTLVQPLLALIQPTPMSFPPIGGSSVHPPTTSALSAIHICALECLNNMFLSLASKPNPAIKGDAASGRGIWDAMWTALGALGLVGKESGLGQEKRKDMWNIAVGVLWGIGNVWKGVLVPNEEQVKILIQLGDATFDDQVCVKCIGTLECLAQHPESIEANKVISLYLLDYLPSETQTWRPGTEPILQSASALIDIYSDENMPYDVNFREGNYGSRLAASVDKIKKVVRRIDWHRDGGRELRQRGEEVRENLVAFIQYRKDLGF